MIDLLLEGLLGNRCCSLREFERLGLQQLCRYWKHSMGFLIDEIARDLEEEGYVVIWK